MPTIKIDNGNIIAEYSVREEEDQTVISGPIAATVTYTMEDIKADYCEDGDCSLYWGELHLPEGISIVIGFPSVYEGDSDLGSKAYVLDNACQMYENVIRMAYNCLYWSDAR